MWLIFLIKATEEVKIHYVIGNITSPLPWSLRGAGS